MLSNTIKICDSYKVSKKRFDAIIDHLHLNLPLHPIVKNRTRGSIKREWATHNLLYNLHICRTRTKDVDINYPLKTIELFTYNTIGYICLFLIK